MYMFIFICRGVPTLIFHPFHSLTSNRRKNLENIPGLFNPIPGSTVVREPDVNPGMGHFRPSNLASAQSPNFLSKFPGNLPRGRDFTVPNDVLRWVPAQFLRHSPLFRLSPSRFSDSRLPARFLRFWNVLGVGFPPSPSHFSDSRREGRAIFAYLELVGRSGSGAPSSPVSSIKLEVMAVASPRP